MYSFNLENGKREDMIKIRIDVDYAYPARLRSFISTALNIRLGKDYLRNSKILAKIINESSEAVAAYWFFTPQTNPDPELLELLIPERHEVALHVATKPYLEWERLEKTTGRTIKYYTVHGTERLLARLVWKRKIWEAKAPVPQGFPLKSFYDYPTLALDWLCYRNRAESAIKIARNHVAKGEVMHVHPEWLFQRGTLNRRGPYYETLKGLLNVDKELDGLQVKKKGFARLAKYVEENEYLHDPSLSSFFLGKLAERQIDIFTFVERNWCCPIKTPNSDWLKAGDNVALLKIIPFADWLTVIGKKTRNMIRKAEKSGVRVNVAEPSGKFAEGLWKIYNETPIRQGRAFSHYGLHLETVKELVAAHAEDSTYAGAYLDGELVGLIQLVYGDQIAVMAQILSLQKHWDKAVNNALVAKAVDICALRNVPWLMYGRMGNHPSLDSFKESNGFTKYVVNRYYVPLTRRGCITIRLGLHREVKDALPGWLKGPLVPVFNWVSRTKMRAKQKLR